MYLAFVWCKDLWRSKECYLPQLLDLVDNTLLLILQIILSLIQSLLNNRTNVKQGAHIQQPAAWPVPHPCAEPYHPGSGSYGQLFSYMCATCWKNEGYGWASLLSRLPCLSLSLHSKFVDMTINLLLFFSVTPFKIDQNKNQNRLIV